MGAMQIFGRKAAPILESLELRVHVIDAPPGVAIPFPPFEAVSPLKKLAADGVSLEYWDASIADTLEILDLSFSSPEFLTKLAHHFAKSRSAGASTDGIVPEPVLRHLTLRSDFPYLDRVPVATEVVTSYLSSLTTLVVCGLDSYGLSRLIPLLPRLLQELQLTGLNNLLVSFVDALRTDSTIFPALQTLTLEGIGEPTVKLGQKLLEALRALPALENLSLCCLDPVEFLHAFAQTSEPTEDRLLCPRLCALMLAGTGTRLLTLCTLVEARIADGCPLAVLEVDTPPVLNNEVLRSLEANVPGFKLTPQEKMY